MNKPRPLDIASASRWLASLSVLGAGIGFGYDSLVVAALGPGTSTDAYFLSLGFVAFLPTLFYLTATNVIVPLMGHGSRRPRWEDRAAWGWVVVGLVAGATCILGRSAVAAALSADPLVRDQAAQGLVVLAGVPVLSAWSEYRRARLLASGRYHATGFYVVARNIGMILAAVLLRPRSGPSLCLCVLVGYGVQAVVIEAYRPGGLETGDRNVVGVRPALRGLLSQGIIYGVGYLPVLGERAIADRVGPGLPTIISYSYRIVMMLASVAITSATVPGVAALAHAMKARSVAQVRNTLRHVFDASTRLALPAALLLVTVAAPGGRFLAPRQWEAFALILGLYGLSLVAWTFLRPWSALEYARGTSRSVLLVTAVQSIGTIACAMLALRGGAAYLALGPLVGGSLGVVCAWWATRPDDRSAVRAGMIVQGRWLAGWVLVTVIAGLAGAGVLQLGSGRVAAFVGGVTATALFVAVAWGLRLLRADAVATVTPAPELS